MSVVVYLRSHRAPASIDCTVKYAGRPYVAGAAASRPINSPAQVLFASLIGTTIEFFDFYIYATAAVLVFPKLFFPSTDPASATLASLATFAVASSRPIGSAFFGHFGDRIGRKTTLVAALLTMGVDGEHRIAAYLCIHRDCGAHPAGALPIRTGSWPWRRVGGAVLLAIENAPPGKRAWYGMFRSLVRRSASSSRAVSSRAVVAVHRRSVFPFRVASAVSRECGARHGRPLRPAHHHRDAGLQRVHASERVRVPMFTVFSEHAGMLVAGTLTSLATFVLFYLMTVFTLSWGTTALHYTRDRFLIIQLLGIVCFGVTIPIAAMLPSAAAAAQ